MTCQHTWILISRIQRSNSSILRGLQPLFPREIVCSSAEFMCTRYMGLRTISAYMVQASIPRQKTQIQATTWHEKKNGGHGGLHCYSPQTQGEPGAYVYAEVVPRPSVVFLVRGGAITNSFVVRTAAWPAYHRHKQGVCVGSCTCLDTCL